MPSLAQAVTFGLLSKNKKKSRSKAERYTGFPVPIYFSLCIGVYMPCINFELFI